MSVEIARGLGPARIDIAYERFGEPGLPPVLLIMGLGTQMLGWPDAFCSRLADRGHYVRLASDPDRGPGPETVLSVDFIELVRLGVRRANHPEVRSSIAQVDTHLLWVGPGGPAHGDGVPSGAAADARCAACPERV